MESSLLEKIARLSQQVEELQAEKQRMLDEGSQRSFPSDREARLMKTRNGFVPAYNVQSVVDSQHHLIGAMQVTDHPNDFEDLQPSIHAMQEDLQVEVSQAVADTGYANEEQILALEEEGKVIAVPFNEGDHSPKEDREHGIFLPMMQTMTIIYAPKKRYYLLKTGKFVNMERFIENIREETARVVP